MWLRPRTEWDKIETFSSTSSDSSRYLSSNQGRSLEGSDQSSYSKWVFESQTSTLRSLLCVPGSSPLYVAQLQIMRLDTLVALLVVATAAADSVQIEGTRTGRTFWYIHSATWYNDFGQTWAVDFLIGCRDPV